MHLAALFKRGLDIVSLDAQVTTLFGSTDRPFTESEVRFLKYIRQWGKKVVFLVNKVDILSDSQEVSPSPISRLNACQNSIVKI